MPLAQSTTFENLTAAITLKGPEVTEAILRGYKDVENRHVRLPIGWIALHTGKARAAPHMRSAIHHLSPGMPTVLNFTSTAGVVKTG